ncbi:hypothetical protein [Reichenbachiella ulvae]|uniref:Phage abortive infection protein n=1 Tax=Reichenbachiella ulvae TaxID=2980104 RepID=A0ABT3CPU0_9BACT|nr:hypothetical protein [Reichenbachiella ulvae]MCV9385288.1 hypothetical protein [Reichenbachiella ulvae]
MSKIKPIKKILLPFLIVLFIGILVPIIFYVHQFSGSGLSEDPNNWGVLGDYFGGVLNPIIALASLIILSYLTYLVSEQSNEKNKTLIVFQKRLTAFEELTKPFKDINLLGTRISTALQFTNQLEYLTPESKLHKMIEMKKELSLITNTFTEYYYTLRLFNVNYGHLFEYDFSCEDYKQLLEQMRKLGEYHDDVSNNLFDENKTTELSAEKFQPDQATMRLIAKVINEIRNEILPKNN